MQKGSGHCEHFNSEDLLYRYRLPNARTAWKFYNNNNNNNKKMNVFINVSKFVLYYCSLAICVLLFYVNIWVSPNINNPGRLPVDQYWIHRTFKFCQCCFRDAVWVTWYWQKDSFENFKCCQKRFATERQTERKTNKLHFSTFHFTLLNKYNHPSNLQSYNLKVYRWAQEKLSQKQWNVTSPSMTY